MMEGILCKETHDNILRIAPPLIIEQQELDFIADNIVRTLNSVADDGGVGGED